MQLLIKDKSVPRLIGILNHAFIQVEFLHFRFVKVFTLNHFYPARKDNSIFKLQIFIKPYYYSSVVQRRQ